MAEDLARSEYPAMLTHLQPLQAVSALEQRHKRIAKLNTEIADWLQERRKVEDQYIQSLRKLTMFKVPNASSEMGVFAEPWRKIMEATSTMAASHQMFADHVEKDVEMPLRTFQNKREYLNMSNVHGNLLGMAKELEEAQHGVDKVTKKGGKASVQKAELATTKLESASQQWESQAPYIFEQLQALDEQRVNHLRDILTQYQTHESDNAQRMQSNAETVLNAILELNTAEEIQAFAARVIQGKPKLEKRSSTRTSSNLAASVSASLAPPTQTSTHDDDRSDHSGGRNESHGESSRLRSRLGTMLGRRRQSIHGGFGPISPIKGSGSLSRGLSSSHGRLSPRASQNNLAEGSMNRLSSLVESPDSPNRPTDPAAKAKMGHDGTNGTGPAWTDGPADAGPSTNGAPDEAAALFDFQPPPGPPPGKSKAPEAKQDSEGFTIPPPTNDPISEAQKEAAAESEQPFKLNIQKQPVGEEDVDANKAAMSNVANTLAQLAAPSRKVGTVRGRRDVRNTMYVPSSVPEGSVSDPASAFPPSPTPAMPPPPSLPFKPTAVSALQSESSLAGTSDTQSIRSSNSLGGLSQPKHPDMLGPGLNASIIESVVASFERGQVKSVKVNGEIAFSYNFSATAGSSNKETIRINNFASLESIGPNRIFVQDSPSAERPDEFVLDVSHIARTAIGFTYRVHSDESAVPPALASRVPLLLRTAWKPVGDKLGLVLEYSLNPALAGLPRSSSDPLPFQNLFLVATYEGRAAAAQTRPPSTHLRDKHMVYWRVGDASLVPGEWHKLVCRIAAAASPAGEPAPELKPGRVEARWEYVPPAAAAEGGSDSGVISISKLEEGAAAAEGKGKEKADAEEDDPFADEQLSPMPSSEAAARGKWVDVPLHRRIVSGKYEAV